jgi:WD40 repeat protein
MAKAAGTPVLTDGPIESPVFCPAGTRIATIGGAKSGTVQIWDAQSGRPKGAPLLHDHLVDSCRFSDEGKSLVTMGYVGRVIRAQPPSEVSLYRIHVWELTEHKETHCFDHYDGPPCYSFDHAGKKIVTGGYDHIVRVWDLQDQGVLTPCFEADAGDTVEFVDFHPSKTQIVAVLWEGSGARIWDWQKKTLIKHTSLPER